MLGWGFAQLIETADEEEGIAMRVASRARHVMAAADLPEKDGLERAVPRLLEPGRGGAALMRSAAR